MSTNIQPTFLILNSMYYSLDWNQRITDYTSTKIFFYVKYSTFRIIFLMFLKVFYIYSALKWRTNIKFSNAFRREIYSAAAGRNNLNTKSLKHLRRGLQYGDVKWSGNNNTKIIFRSDMDYGALECWAENNIGRQKHPCVFRYLFIPVYFRYLIFKFHY